MKEQQLAFPLEENLQKLDLDPRLGRIFSRNGILFNLSSESSNENPVLFWPGIEIDSAFYTTVFSSFREELVNDDVFRQEKLPAYKKFLKNTKIYEALSSGEIILTEAHREENIDSQEHIERVLEALITDTLSSDERFIMRVFALMHDNGKALVAGYEDNSEDLMKKVGNVDKEGKVRDSYIDHQLLSSLIFSSIIKTNGYVKDLFSEGEVDYISALISHHHHFSKLKKYLNNNQFEIDAYFSDITELDESKRWEYLLHSFLFNLADIAATRGHWQHLFPNINTFKRLVDIYSKSPDLDSRLLKKMQNSLLAAENRYQFAKSFSSD